MNTPDRGTNTGQPLSRRPSLSGAPKPGAASDSQHKAIDLMQELDSFLQQIKTEHHAAGELQEKMLSQQVTQAKRPAPQPTSPRPERHQPQPSPQPPLQSQPKPRQADPPPARPNEAWLAEHTAALDARQQQLEDRNTALEIERNELRDARLRLEEDAKKLGQQREALEQEKKHLAQWKQKTQARVAALEAERASSSKGQGPVAAADAGKAGEMTAQLEKQQKQLLVHRQQLERSWAALKQEKAALVRRQRDLESHAAGLPVGSATESEQRLQKMQSEMQKRYVELRAGEAVVDLARQQYSELLEQRQTLVEVKRFLGTVEDEMVRRWSVHRGFGLVGGAVSCLLFLLLFSHSVGQRIVDPVWRATMTVGVTMAVIDESRYGDAWLTENHQKLISDEMITEAIRLSTQRGVRIFDDAPSMREALTGGLSLSISKPGAMLLELRHTNPDLAVEALEALGRAFVNHRNMEDRIAGQASSMEIKQPAARDPAPIEDNRMTASVIMLAVSTVVVTLLAIITWWWLSRSVRVFDEMAIEELDELEDPDRWPTELAELAGGKKRKGKNTQQSPEGLETDGIVAEEENDSEPNPGQHMVVRIDSQNSQLQIEIDADALVAEDDDSSEDEKELLV